MSSAVLTQVKGRGLAFQVRIQSWMSFSNAWMSFSNAWTEVCTPRRMSLSVSRPNQRSTWLIQLDPVGVKWTWNRGDGSARPGSRESCGAVVVGDQVDVQLGRHGLVDGDQELP